MSYKRYLPRPTNYKSRLPAPVDAFLTAFFIWGGAAMLLAALYWGLAFGMAGLLVLTRG